jgi:hypothetical protein
MRRQLAKVAGEPLCNFDQKSFQEHLEDYGALFHV